MIRHPPRFPSGQCPKGNISIEKVTSEDNIADILSLPLKRESLNYLRQGLGMMEHISFDSSPCSIPCRDNLTTSPNSFK
ncbi:hypothetical protein Tco_0986480 [Tanacetum coccineum]